MSAGSTAGPGRPHARRRLALQAVTPPLVVFVALIGAWELGARAGVIHPILFPAPSRIAQALLRLVTSTFFFESYVITLGEIVAGFAIGATVGVALGVLFALSSLLRAVFYPYMIAFQALPKIVLAPLFVVWFGFGPESKIVMAATICFFPMLVNTMLGLTLVDPAALRLMRSLTAGTWRTFLTLRVPSALPALFTGIKTSLTYAMVGAIVAEFTGALKGIGRLVRVFNAQLQIDFEIAVILTVSLLGLLVYFGVEGIERRVVFWRERAGHAR